MRTWKQGVIGKIELDNGKIVYTKCLKYPLLKIADSYDIIKSEIRNELISIFVDLNVLKRIEKIGFDKISKDENEIGLAFDMEYMQGTSVIEKMKMNEAYFGIKAISDKGLINWEKLNRLIIDLSVNE